MNRWLGLSLLLALTLGLTACGGGSTGLPFTTDSPPDVPPPPPPGDTSMSPSELAKALEVLDLVNQIRQQNGLGTLTWDNTAAEVAYRHSLDMDVRDFFAHTNPDGDSPGDRLTAGGVAWTAYGENIAMGYATAQDVMDAWMNSPGHRDNILYPNFTHLGVGVHENGSTWWTQNFFRP